MTRALTSAFCLLTSALLTACLTSTSAPPKQPTDREWPLLTADYQWLETLRKAQQQPPAGASRKVMIETELSNHEKLKPTWDAFDGKVREYYDRTRDPRAAKMIAREKILMGDQFMGVLSR